MNSLSTVGLNFKKPFVRFIQSLFGWKLVEYGRWFDRWVFIGIVVRIFVLCFESAALV